MNTTFEFLSFRCFSIEKSGSALPHQNTGTQLIGGIGIHGFIGGTPDVYMMGKIRIVTKFLKIVVTNTIFFHLIYAGLIKAIIEKQ